MAYFPISMLRNLKTNYWDQPASLFLYVRSSLIADPLPDEAGRFVPRAIVANSGINKPAGD